jgi:hypothetical protein
MNSIQDFKKKGRILRAQLAKAFQQEVSLSAAYEVLAAMEGAKDWNTLIAASRIKGTLNYPATVIEYTQLLKPEQHTLLCSVCAVIWSVCVEGWRARSTLDSCEYLIEASDIFAGLSALGITLSGPEGYADEVERHIESTLVDLGYYTKAAQLAKGTLALENALAERAGTEESSTAYAFSHCMEALTVVDIDMLGMLPDYDTPEQIAEWTWIETHHSFAHRGNGVEGGVWEFMVRVDKASHLDDVPFVLRPLFEEARKAGASWLMFHQ